MPRNSSRGASLTLKSKDLVKPHNYAEEKSSIGDDCNNIAICNETDANNNYNPSDYLNNTHGFMGHNYKKQSNKIAGNSNEIANLFHDYCISKGIDAKNAKYMHELVSSFLNECLVQEVDILRSAKSLRKEVTRIPKPPIKWTNRKSEGDKITVGSVLGNYDIVNPDCPDRSKLLSELNVEDWWNAFFRDDVESGATSESEIRRFDPTFRMAARRANFFSSSEVNPINTADRLNNMSNILGCDTKTMKTFMFQGIHGDATKPDSNSISEPIDAGTLKNLSQAIDASI